jgi:hypothetical protein
MGNGGIAPPFLTSALDGCEWSASGPGEIAPGTHWIGGWVGPRVGLDAVEKRKTEPIFMKLGMYIRAPKPISTAYFINHFNQSVCLYVYHPVVARQLLCKKRYRSNEYTCTNKIIDGRVVFYAVHVVSEESRLLVLPRTSCIIYNTSLISMLIYCSY